MSRRFVSRPCVSERPQQGFDPYKGRGLSFVLRSDGFEGLRSSSTGLTFGVRNDNFLQLNLHSSTRTGQRIIEQLNGFLDIA